MRKAVDVYEVLIASPGDVKEERIAIRETIHAWNSEHSETYNVQLQPVYWELDATPEMGARAQEIINKQIVDKADILIGIFWTRLGTPTGEAESGTAEEVQRFRDMGKRVMLYFSDREISPSKIDDEQYQRLRSYRASCEGLCNPFTTVEDLRERVKRHLTKAIIDLRKASRPAAENATPMVATIRPEDIASLESLFRSAPHAVVPVYRKFVDQLCEDLRETEPEFDEFENIDEAIMTQVASVLPLSIRFAQATDLAVNYGNDDALGVLDSVFGRLLGLCHPADRRLAGYTSCEFDGFRFAHYEMFVAYVSVVVKAEQWDYLHKVLSTRIYDDSGDGGRYRHFSRLSVPIRSLQHDRQQRLGTKRVSVVSDLIKTRHENTDGWPMKHREFMSGDYFLFVRSLCESETSNERLWFPQSCLYLDSAPQFLRKCESRQYADRFVRAVGLADIAEFVRVLREGHGTIRAFFEDSSWEGPLKDSDFSRIGSIP